MKRPVIIIVGILAILAISQMLLPKLVATLIARGMNSAVASDQISAQTTKTPAFLMLAGEFDSVVIHANNAKIDKINFAELDAALKDVAVDMEALFTGKALMVKSVKEVDLTAVITQEELGRYLNQTVKGVKNAVVTVNAGKVQVTSNLSLGFATMAVTLDGKIVGDGQKIKFVTDRFMLNNATVGNVGGSLLTEIPLIDLKKLPFGVGVRSIDMDGGKVTIHADNRPQ
jgi:hypothetical protein